MPAFAAISVMGRSSASCAISSPLFTAPPVGRVDRLGDRAGGYPGARAHGKSGRDRPGLGAILRPMDIPSFLRLHPPFDDLDDDRLAEVVRHAHIEFFPEGTVILQEFGEPAGFLYMVRRGAVEVVEAGEVVDVEGEGEVFGFVSLLTGASPLVTIRAQEDVICYLIDRDIGEEVMSSRRGMVFLASAFRRRDVRALEHVARAAVDEEEEAVSALVRRGPLSMPAETTIRQAAERMASEREGFVLLEGTGEHGLAILTDRDLRTKVLAEGRDPSGLAADVASSPVMSVPGDATVAEVTALMLERGVHHVPVEDGNG